MKVDVEFRVNVETKPGESVCIVGDCHELGNWDPHLARPLRLVGKTDDGLELWTCSLRLSITQEIKYRYFIGFLQDAETDGESKHVMVRVWETNVLPRKFSVRTLCALSEDQHTNEDTFGLYNGRKAIDKGWLTGQTEIHFRLHGAPINMWKRRHREQTYSIRCTAIDLRYKDASFETDMDGEESNHELINAGQANQVLVSVLNERDNIPHEQPLFGSVYEENDYMVFRAQTFEPEYLGFKFEFYVQRPCSSPGDIPKHVGVAFVLPINLKEAIGVKTTPINGLKHVPIGQLTVDFLVIKPMSRQPCDMSVSYANHWEHKRRPLDVGHRGMGTSHCDPAKKCAVVRENTIASLSEAGGHGADFVEFDVQLSKDNIPVIYHDFTVCLTLRKREGSEHELFEIPVKDLNLDQLQALKVDHSSEKGNSPGASQQNGTDEPAEHLPFPTLKQAFEQLDPHIGFNIEIKYSSQMKSGEFDGGLTQYHERNQYADVILEDILRYGGDRRIVMSCFDPDFCTVLRLKQNRYPVFLLCQGDTSIYPPFMDARTWTLPQSYNYCQCEKLLGVAPFSERLLANPSLLEKAKMLNLIVFTWGEQNNHVENIKKLKDMGVEAVIYDRIYELKDSKENVFLMEHYAKVDLLRKMGILDSDSPPPKTLPRISSEDVGQASNRKPELKDIGRQYSMPL